MPLSSGKQIGLFSTLRDNETSTCLVEQSLGIIIVINEESISGGLLIFLVPQINRELLGLSQFVHSCNEMVLQLNFFN